MVRIVDRCFPWRYGDEYLPALLATRTEGGSYGRLHRIPAPGLNRELHFMSAAEARIAAWVIYQPNFIEILENRPCMPIPGIAILDGHPLLVGKTLPYSSGTIEVARRLKIKHQVTKDDRPVTERKSCPRPPDAYPMTSDVLGIFGSSASIRAVHLFVKKTEKDLDLQGRDKDNFSVIRAYYAEANIPTVKICEEYLDRFVTNNLMRILKLGVLPANLSHEQIADALLFMQERIFTSAPVTWSTTLREELGLSFSEVFRIFHYGVLRRYLKPDLQEAVAMDRIHRMERCNFAAHFADRFLNDQL